MSQKKKKFRRKAWSEEETAAIKRQLKDCLLLNRVPRKDEAMKALQFEPTLHGRTWKNVKDFVYNLVKKNRPK